MKKSITLLALILSVTTAVFASSPVKTAPTDDIISIRPTEKSLSIGVRVKKDNASRSFVKLYNNNNSVIFEDVLGKKTIAGRAYSLSDLETGNYTIEVTADKQVVKRQIRVYEENGQKTYFFFQ